VVKVTKRKALIKFLNKHGIFPLIHYPIPIHRQNAYKNKIKFFGNKNSFENLNQKILSLPIYPELKLIEQKYVIRKIKEFYEKF
jgi:dTDP-4-amino-4,6-dideoxygalactose transaminase